MEEEKKSLKHLLTVAQIRVVVQHEMNFKQCHKGRPGMPSQIRAAQTSPEQGPFLLLMAGTTITVINASQASHNSAEFYGSKEVLQSCGLLRLLSVSVCCAVSGWEGTELCLAEEEKVN